MLKKKLPIQLPPITSLSPVAFPLSILMNYENGKHFFYNNYIALHAYKKRNGNFHISFRPSLFFDHIPQLKVFKMSYKLSFNNNSFIDFIINGINQGFYFMILLDWFFISESQLFRKEHFSHKCLIYEYDISEKKFMAMDFIEYGKLKIFEIKFNELVQSNRQIMKLIFKEELEENKNYFVALKYKNNIKYKFEIKFFIKLLEDYFYSKNSIDSYMDQERMKNKHLVTLSGLKIYDDLCSYILGYTEENRVVDRRSFHILYDHKVSMKLKINYLGKNGYLKNYQYFLDEYEKIEKLALNIRNRFLRYIITHKRSILEQNVQIINSLKRKEMDCIEKLLNCITEF